MPKEKRGLRKRSGNPVLFGRDIMRDLVFRNLTSTEKKRKVLASSEVMDREGIHSVIHRHFVCMVKELKEQEPAQSQPVVYILKERNSKEQREKFFCRIKGRILVTAEGHSYVILFVHSLKITLTTILSTS